ncbi:MAG: thioredoxin family protein [Chlorobiaceae bacterium]|nr:thioredoxin family protein [Chlorobiaceae bacterium]MBA4309406.1 thioredoxin family protein [Chlorobiaceae bacterium]
MNKLLFLLMVLFSINLNSQNVEIDKAAPEFSLKDRNGKTHSLADYKGKYVVLEWINFDCPFVKKHYETENMQSLQNEFRGKGVVWLLICSSAPGKQGNFDAKEINKRLKNYKVDVNGYLIDETGEVGKMYGAKTTPHMFVIDKKGKLVYAGAIDDKPSTDKEDIKDASNYVKAALNSLMNSEVITTKVTKPYGCSVKY